MTSSYKKIMNHHLLYDAAILPEVSPDLFDPEEWRKRHTVLGETHGRGTTHFVSDGKQSFALRHYRRGGIIAKLVSDAYLWFVLSRTRAWREWHLLNKMFQGGLPVPKPVAAQVVRFGWYYSADLLTVYLPDCRSLATCLEEGSLTKKVWVQIGKCIRRFHDNGIYHSDLNAHNILLDGNCEVYLVDFDKGRERTGPDAWKKASLFRLNRSLAKLRREGRSNFFSDEEWQTLLSGYGEREGSIPR